MNTFFLAEIFLALTVTLLIVLFSMIWPPDSPWSPWWRTTRKVARRMCKLGKITKKDIIYDLGSGDGVALRVAAKEFGARGVGVEIDPFRVGLARLLNLASKQSVKITVKRQDFFKTDITEATVIFVYLIPRALAALEKKFQKELRPGTRVISYTYPIPYLDQIAEDKTEHIFVYKISASPSRRTKQSRS